MKLQFSPLFLLAQESWAEFASSTNPDRLGSTPSRHWRAVLTAEQAVVPPVPARAQPQTEREDVPTNWDQPELHNLHTHDFQPWSAIPRPRPRELNLKGVLPSPLTLHRCRVQDWAMFLHTAEAGRTLTGCSEEGIHQLVTVLASRVRQAAGRHGGSVLERELFGRFHFLVGFVLPLRFQHALEVQA